MSHQITENQKIGFLPSQVRTLNTILAKANENSPEPAPHDDLLETTPEVDALILGIVPEKRLQRLL